MRSKHLISTLIFVWLSHITTYPVHAQDRVGNGGDFKEMEFIATAYEALDVLTALRLKNHLDTRINLANYEKALRQIKVSIIEQVRLTVTESDQDTQSIDRSGANYPATLEVELTEKDWDANKNNTLSRLRFVLHETLPLIGISDKNYQVSAPLVNKATEFNLIKSLASSAPQPSSNTPVLLYSTYWSHNRIGISYYAAQEECEQVKSRYAKKYFFTYCEYLEKFWYEKTYEYERPYYKNVQYEREEVYGLRVYGWASLEFAPWSVVANSLGLVDGFIDRTFATPRAAYRACLDRLRNARGTNAEKFYRAKCRSPKVNGSDRYFYEIITQNPLANESN